MAAKAKIYELIQEREWSKYRLALASGLSQSTERCYIEFSKHGMNKARMVMNTI